MHKFIGKRHDETNFGVQVMRNAAGEVLSDPVDISNGFLQHFVELGSMPDHLRQVDWSTRIPQPQQTAMDELDDPISWPEVVTAIRKANKGTAPGLDAVHIDVLAAAVGGTDEEEEEPTSPFSKALFGVISAMWMKRQVPSCWTDSLVRPIYKNKGDPGDFGNYRGISLISSTLKVLSAVVANRLQASLERRNRIVQEQNGFRSRFEAVGTAAALMEVVLRRRRQQQDNLTIISCFDMAKAYDCVPWGALFYVLQQYGVPQRCLAFLRALYSSARIRVRDRSGHLSRAASLERGVRQGCPMSPILFSIFVNSVFHASRRGNNVYYPRQEGVVVPGCERKLLFLLFADDIVGLSANCRDALRMYEHLETFAERVGMRWNAKKCAILPILPNAAFTGRKDSGRTLTAAGHRQLGRITRFMRRARLHGEPLPVVEKTKYLGISLDLDLSLTTIAEARASNARRHVFAVRRQLSNQRIPIPLRIAYIRGVILPQLMYGSELYGYSQDRTRKAEQVISLAMRFVVGVPKRLVSSVVLHSELGVSTAYAHGAARAVRLLVKMAGHRSILGDLVRDHRWVTHPRNSTYASWVSCVRTWSNRFLLPSVRETRRLDDIPEGVWHKPDNQGEVIWALPTTVQEVGKIEEDYDEDEDGLAAQEQSWAEESKLWAAMVQGVLKYKSVWNPSAPGNRFQWYSARELSRTTLCTQDCLTLAPWLNRGIQFLVQVRMKLLRVNGESLQGATRNCATCGVNESWEHFFFHCPQWQEARQRWLRPIMRAARSELGMAALETEVLTLIIGGVVRGVSLRQWRPSIRRLLASNQEANRLKHFYNGGAVRVGAFLMFANRVRVASGQESLFW